MTESITTYVSIVVVILILCYPEEAYYQAERGILLAKLFLINAYCFLVALFLYVGLLWSFRKMGLPAPAFRFTPVWKRQ